MLSVPSFLPLFFCENLSQFTNGCSLQSLLNLAYYPLNLSSFSVKTSLLLSLYPILSQISGKLFIRLETTCFVIYNLIYLHYYIRIVLTNRKESVFNLYFLCHLLQFVFIISTYSPLLLDSPFCFFLELRDAFTGKKRFFHALFCE